MGKDAVCWQFASKDCDIRELPGESIRWPCAVAGDVHRGAHTLDVRDAGYDT